MSNAAITVSKLDIGPCQVFFDGDDMGATLDNVVVNFKYEKADLKSDQTGSAVLDQAVSGIDVTIETSVAMTREKATILKNLFKSADYAGTAPADYLDFKDKVALRMLTLSKTLKLHPLVEADAGKDYDWTFWKAIPTEESSYTFGPSEQGKMKIVWRVLLDMTTTPGRMFRYGDATL